MNTLTRTHLEEGDVIANWTVLRDTGQFQGGSRLLRCHCLCGKERAVREENILRGLSKSCGCLAIQNTKRAQTGVPKRRKNRVGDQIGDFTIVGLRNPELSKEAAYFGQCVNGHRITLTRNYVNNPSRASCWCQEENLIRRYRRKKGLTIQEIADTLCYSRTSIQITQTKPEHSTEPILLAVGELLEIPEEELLDYIQTHRSKKEVSVYG